jgi:hypothetical protein
MDNDDSNTQMEERNLFLRIVYCVLWFIPFYFVTGMIIGGVVGGMAGIHAKSFQEGAALARPAVQAFYDKNGFFVVAFQVMAYAALCLLRWVPGVSKYKRTKRQ